MSDETKETKYMSVMKMGELLGLKKVESYWLVKKGFFNVITFAGKMWIEIASFEQWYSQQDHYHKVAGITEEDIRKDYYSIRDMMELLDMGESTAYRVISKEGIPCIRLFGKKRILKEDFWTWYDHQDRYHIPECKLPEPPDHSSWLTMSETAQLLGITDEELFDMLKDPAYKSLLPVIRFEGRGYVSTKEFGYFLRKQTKYSYDPRRDPAVAWRDDRTCLTTLQAEWYGKVSKTTITKWCRDGCFPVKRLGRYIRIPLKDFENWLIQRLERSGDQNGIHNKTGQKILCDLQL